MIRPPTIILLLAAALPWTVACGTERAGNCFLAEGTYTITYSLKTSSCQDGVIQPSWTEEREISKPLNCGDREETFNKYIGGGCFEDCTEKQSIEGQSFSGTMTCDMACGGESCRYETTFAAQPR